MPFRRTRDEEPHRHRPLAVLLALCLLVAALHVSFHDVTDTAAAAGSHQCQVCRLNHIPGAALHASLFAAPLFVAIRLAPPRSARPLSRPFLHPWRARTPPLF